MLFRSATPDSTVWKRFRSGQDGFTFTRTGDIYEAKVVANAERVVDLFYTLSELMAPAVVQSDYFPAHNRDRPPRADTSVHFHR